MRKQWNGCKRTIQGKSREKTVNPPKGGSRKDRERQVTLEARPPRACGGLSRGEQASLAEGNTNSPLWRGLIVFHLFGSGRRAATATWDRAIG